MSAAAAQAAALSSKAPSSAVQTMVAAVSASPSPDNTVIRSGSTAAITDANGNRWTITSGSQVAVNGVADTTTGRVITLAYEKGLIWQENADRLWWSKKLPTDRWGPEYGTSVSPIPTTPPPPPPPASGEIGSGSDTIVVKMSGDPDGPVGNTGRFAQFTLNVDGKQIGGLQTVSAIRSQGQTQTFTFKGNYGPGAHKVTITFANNSMTQGDKAAFNTGGDRNLYVNQLTYNGTVVSNTVKGIYESPWYPPEATDGVLHPGNAVYTVNDTTAIPAGAPSTPTTTPGPVSYGTGPDKLVLMMSEDPFEGDAQFTVKVDGVQVGGVFTTKAVQWQGQQQQFTLSGNWGPGSHSVQIAFVNDHAKLDANGWGIDSKDRNLYINSIRYNGGPVAAGTPWEIPTNTSRTFSVTSGATAQAAPTTTSLMAMAAMPDDQGNTTGSTNTATISPDTLGQTNTKMAFAGASESGFSPDATTVEEDGLGRPDDLADGLPGCGPLPDPLSVPGAGLPPGWHGGGSDTGTGEDGHSGHAAPGPFGDLHRTLSLGGGSGLHQAAGWER